MQAMAPGLDSSHHQRFQREGGLASTLINNCTFAKKSVKPFIQRGILRKNKVIYCGVLRKLRCVYSALTREFIALKGDLAKSGLTALLLRKIGQN